MNKMDFKKMLLGAFSGFLSLAMAIAFYFVLLRFSQLRQIARWLKGILQPFIIGGILAYLLKTPCNFFLDLFERHLPDRLKKRSNLLSVLTVLVLAVLAVYLLLALVLPELFSSISTLTAALPGQVNRFTKWLQGVTEEDSIAAAYLDTAVTGISEKLRAWSQADLLPMLQDMMGGFASTVGNIVSLISNTGIGFIVCIYLLMGRKTFARQGKMVIYGVFPSRLAGKVMEEIKFIDRTFVGFFGGKILDSAIIGLICYVFCLIMSFAMGFPNALLVSVIVGITNIIPYFGPFIGAVPSALLILMSSPVNCVIFLIFIIILQQIDGNILGPRLLANSVGLSGFWVLFSITVFGGIFGFAGILVGVPVFAVIYDLIRRLVLRGLRRHGVSDTLYK